MHSTDWLQFALFFGLLTLITKPLGLYLMQVLDANGRTWLDPIIKSVEKLTYRLLGVDPQREQGWKQYTFAMLAFSLVGVVFTYVILRLQDVLPWNPQGLPALSHHLAFNTAVSFTTNTNWQSYGGEGTGALFPFGGAGGGMVFWSTSWARRSSESLTRWAMVRRYLEREVISSWGWLVRGWEMALV